MSIHSFQLFSRAEKRKRILPPLERIFNNINMLMLQHLIQQLCEKILDFMGLFQVILIVFGLNDI